MDGPDSRRDLEARVLNIQRMSTEDGPGIRTTVFFKGCPLACSWCHNPESIDPRPQIMWQEWKCIGCRECVEACPSDAITLDQDGARTDLALCKACGSCADECPTTARQLLGRCWTLDDLVDEVIKDRAFFESSGGGVTCSGGEPGFQGGFIGPFLERLRGLGIHVAVDTCGLVGPRVLSTMGRAADLMLFDLKLVDAEQHRHQTGQSNQRILANLRELARQMKDGGGPGELWVRTPLIPGVTADAQNLGGLGAVIARELDGLVSRWELCAFNNMCIRQYQRLGRHWPFEETELLTPEELESCAEIARHSGVDPEIVRASGPTRVPVEEAS
jgi:pyruvate formate lyase activating enzyme